ncbi:kWG Leptospira repeat protein [Clostridium sp. CAG:967]|nr:kWG Leptospira repeat protein [Clostridium sp. CAG:967]
MKKFLLILSFILLLQNSAYSADGQSVQVFSEKNLFGLKDASGNVTVRPEYKKLIRLGKSSYIVQKKNRFGMIDSAGNYLVEPKYTHTERVLGRYAKFGNDSNYGLYDAEGKMILPHEYTKIDLLFGGMFLTYKDYKYGVVDFNGRTILENKFDDIYMPKANIMRIKYEGEWYEIERIASEELQLPEDITTVKTDKNFKVTNLITDTGAVSGYSVLTFTDYLIKVFSSISPAHEETIDELMLSQGAETVSIFIKLSWLPKYPFTYAKKYFSNLRNPNNGPLVDVRNELKQKIK